MIVAPSILSANFLNLEADLKIVNENADIIHLDIMDGVFVPNLSYGTPVIKAITKVAKLPVEAHLMVVEPQKFYKTYKELGISSISVHYEACTHLDRDINLIKELEMKAGVAINPHTDESVLKNIIRVIDYVVVMSVNPGFGGQSYIPYSTEKIERVKELIEKYNPECKIEIDGGVSLDNIESIAKAGGDIVVAGNSVFGSKDPAQTIRELQGINR